ncbi:MAG TPA: prepilin-type N-terminal cleavage/methylation domain-containing protein, partial [Candidatus Ozemobacteraceae bacterium]|nr:prepilin-type N-terminal cleavage/methylation domain-containing protein [Candidatus Ozemobacteraceae bacterium]
MKRRGMTLTEIIIAAAIFSGFMVAVFSIYRSGTESFITGSWRVNAQKQARAFLTQLRDDLESANNPAVMATDTTTFPASTPIFLNAGGFADHASTTQPLLSLSGTTWTPACFMVISRPCQRGTIFQPAAQGQWVGVSVWGQSRKLRYVRSGVWGTFSGSPAAFPTGVTYSAFQTACVTSGDFAAATQKALNQTFLEDADRISFRRKWRTLGGQQEMVLEIVLRMVRMRNGIPLNDTFVEERIDAKIQPGTLVNTF